MKIFITIVISMVLVLLEALGFMAIISITNSSGFMLVMFGLLMLLSNIAGYGIAALYFSDPSKKSNQSN